MRLIGPSVWEPFRSGIPSSTSWNVGDLSILGARLVAGAGGNGNLYVNDEDTATWTERTYDLDLPGAFRVVLDLETVGSALLLGGTTGLYRSTDQGDTWSRSPTPGPIDNASIVATRSQVFAALTSNQRGTDLYVSDDDGATWRLFASLPRAFVTDLKVAGSNLYAGRFDGLWSLPLAATESNR